MKNKDIHDKIHRAVSHSVPDVLDRVLHDCAALDKQSAARKPVARRRFQSLYAASAMIVMLAVALIGINIQTAAAKVDSLIFLDVNPSIKISVDKDENVLQVKALNEDAKDILAAADLKNGDLNATMGALVDALIQHGYLKEHSSSVLVSVQNPNSDKNAQLRLRLTNQITAQLQAHSLSGAVVSQALLEDNVEVNILADQYDVSPGKARLVKRLMDSDTDYKAENLADLPVNDLLLLTQNKPDTAPASPNNRPAAPPANERSYIGSETATQVALAQAKTNAAAAKNLTVQMNYKDHKMVYEVKFTSGNRFYEIDVDAHSGRVLRYNAGGDETITNDNNSGGESLSAPPSANDEGGNNQGDDEQQNNPPKDKNDKENED